MKKQIAILLAVIACVGVFTACKKENKQDLAVTEQTPVEVQPVVGEELETAKKEIEGAWAGKDGSMDMYIYFRDDVCNVDIECLKENSSEYWHFSGDLAKKDSYQVMGSNCSKYEVTAENGFTQELVYEDGVSTIVLKDGVITWDGAGEDAGNGMTFTKVEDMQ